MSLIRIPSRIVLALAAVFFFGCENKDLPQGVSVSSVDCSTSLLAISVVSKSDASSCNLIDGNIFVAATAGKAPYSFSINGGVFQTGNGFFNLGPGIYNVSVQDALLCIRTIQVDLFGDGSALDATAAIVADTECLSGNGSLTITATGGVGPYTYQFGKGGFTKTDFHQDNLRTGYYTITVRDSVQCPKQVNVFVPRGNTGVSYAALIKPMVTQYCAITGCHNGDNGVSRDWTNFTTFQKNAQNIKTRTGNRSMPLTGSLTDDQIALIACWVDDGANQN